MDMDYISSANVAQRNLSQLYQAAFLFNTPYSLGRMDGSEAVSASKRKFTDFSISKILESSDCESHSSNEGHSKCCQVSPSSSSYSRTSPDQIGSTPTPPLNGYHDYMECQPASFMKTMFTDSLLGQLAQKMSDFEKIEETRLPPNDRSQNMRSAENTPMGLSSRSLRKNRTIYSTRQIELLERTFEKAQYLNAQTRAALASELNLDENRIKIWFQNRRSKARRGQQPYPVSRVLGHNKLPHPQDDI